MKPDDLPPGFRRGDPTAGDKAHTDRTPVTFKFIEGRDGGPAWVLIEEDDPGLPVLRAGNASLGLVFREGVSFEQARDFAKQMQQMLVRITYTKLIT